MSETIRVERGIKRPVTSGLTQQIRQKLKRIGESFLWPKEKRNGIHAAAICAGVKIQTAIDRKSPTKVRVWRVK